MNTFFTLCIAGIITNSVGIAFDLSILNIIGSLLTAIGACKLPLEGTTIKKARRYAYISVPFSVVAFILTFASSPEIARDIACVQLAINTFFYIYFTYYFSESLINHAQSIHELAITRNFRSVWTMCGIIAFAYFLIYSALIPSIVMIAKAVLLIGAMYYCFTIYNASKLLIFKK